MSLYHLQYFHGHAYVAVDREDNRALKAKMGWVCVILALHVCHEIEGPFFPCLLSVCHPNVPCLHVCIYLSANNALGLNKSPPVVPLKGYLRFECSLSLLLLFNRSSFTLMCTENQSWEESRSVCGGHLFFLLSRPPSLPPSLRVAVREVRLRSSERRKRSCQWCSLLWVSRWKLQYCSLMLHARI